jgi:hypothetical protein
MGILILAVHACVIVSGMRARRTKVARQRLSRYLYAAWGSTIVDLLECGNANLLILLRLLLIAVMTLSLSDKKLRGCRPSLTYHFQHCSW